MDSKMKAMDAFSELVSTKTEAITVKRLKTMEPKYRDTLLTKAATVGHGGACLVCGKRFRQGEYYVEDTADAGCSTCIECTDENLTINWKQLVVRRAG